MQSIGNALIVFLSAAYPGLVGARIENRLTAGALGPRDFEPCISGITDIYFGAEGPCTLLSLSYLLLLLLLLGAALYLDSLNFYSIWIINFCVPFPSTR